MMWWLVFSRSASGADFNCDGVEDFAVGVRESFPGFPDAGAVHVLRGYDLSVLDTPVGAGFFHQDTVGVPDVNASAEGFGAALGGGDIDGDGCDDLVIGAPTEDVAGIRAGAVTRLEVVHGSDDDCDPSCSPLIVPSSQVFAQDSAGVLETSENGDGFGQSVAVADFDGDGYADVAIGAPGEAVGGAIHAGVVQVLRGSPAGITTTYQALISQDSPDVAGVAEAEDRFGEVSAAGDFDGDGYADLAIGIPNEDWGGVDEGAVQVMYGSPSGPSAPNDELWTAGAAGVAGTVDDAAACGASLAVGDYNGDGYDDLAVGCPGDAVGGDEEAGSVLVLYGSVDGFAPIATATFDQDTAGILGTAQPGDRFGAALAAGDFDGDGSDDLAIGAPLESWLGTEDGVVHVLFGTIFGLLEVGNQLVDPGGDPQDYQHLGASLAAGDYFLDGYDELVIGVPDHDAPSGAVDAGRFYLLEGSPTGPVSDELDGTDQGDGYLEDSPEASDRFGSVLF